jgi:hypothetical protein
VYHTELNVGDYVCAEFSSFSQTQYYQHEPLWGTVEKSGNDEYSMMIRTPYYCTESTDKDSLSYYGDSKGYIIIFYKN